MKLQIEKERFMSVTRSDFADTFEKFIDYIDEDDHEHQQTIEQIKNQVPKRECQYCKQIIVPPP